MRPSRQVRIRLATALGAALTAVLFLLPIEANAQPSCRSPADECCRKIDGEIDQECMVGVAVVANRKRIDDFDTSTGDPNELAEMWLLQAVFLAQADLMEEVRPALDMALIHPWTDPATHTGEPFPWELKLVYAGGELSKIQAFEETIYLLSKVETAVKPWVFSDTHAQRLSLGSRFIMAPAFLSLGIHEQAHELIHQVIHDAETWGMHEILESARLLLKLLPALSTRIESENDVAQWKALVDHLPPGFGDVKFRSQIEVILRVADVFYKTDRSQPAPDSFTELLGDVSDLDEHAVALLETMDAALASSYEDNGSGLPLFEQGLDAYLPPQLIFETETRLALLALKTRDRSQGIRGVFQAFDSLQTRWAHLASKPAMRGALRLVDAELFAEIIDALGQQSELAGLDYAERVRIWTAKWQLGGWPSNTPERSPDERRLEADMNALELLWKERPEKRTFESRERLETLRQDFAAARERRTILESARPGSPRPIQTEELRERLPDPRDAVLYYFVGREFLWIWALTSDGIRETGLGMAAEDWDLLSCMIEDLRWLPAGGGAFSTCDPGNRSIAERLYGYLIYPVRSALRGRDRLTIVPHGELQRLSFAALRNFQTGRLLIEDFEIHYQVSMTEAYRRPEQVVDPSPKRALILGDPASGEPLARARDEALGAARRLGAPPLIGDRATESVLQQNAPDAVLLHIAAHGEFHPDRPIFNRIRLAPDQDHDGALHLYEIWDRLSLKKAPLVVLSACLTRRASEAEDIGLTHAFLSARAGAVISTLWPVDDLASQRLMDRFYELWSTGKPAISALHTAQLELSRTPNFEDPRFWAGFVLTGNPSVRW